MPRNPNVRAATAELRRRAEASLNEQRNAPGSKVRNQKRDAGTERLLHELEVHQIELEMQNAELRTTRHDLEVALQKYTDLYDFAPVGYLSIDESGMILESNLTGAALLGVERLRLAKQSLLPFIALASRPTFRVFLKDVFIGQETHACELQLLKAGGGTFWASFRATPAVSHHAGEKYCQSAFGDITARTRAAQLTAREMDVLRLIAASHANKQSAAELGISRRTVEKHRTHLMEKLGIHDTAGLTRYAISSGAIKSSVRLTIY